MLKRASMETQRSSGFPADLLTILMLPALAIFALVFGPQRGWIVLLLIGLFELLAGFVLLRRTRSSASGWLAVVVGILALAAGIRFAFTPW
jgi:uncharacterized membrane protein HdeD (DUF308 family)